MARKRQTTRTRVRTRHAHRSRTKREPRVEWSLDALKRALRAMFTDGEVESGVWHSSYRKVGRRFGIPHSTLADYGESMRRELHIASQMDMRDDRRHWPKINRYIDRLMLRSTGPPPKLPGWFDGQLANHIVTCDTAGTPLCVGFFIGQATELARYFVVNKVLKPSEVPKFDSHWLKRFLDRHSGQVCLSNRPVT